MKQHGAWSGFGETPVSRWGKPSDRPGRFRASCHCCRRGCRRRGGRRAAGCRCRNPVGLGARARHAAVRLGRRTRCDFPTHSQPLLDEVLQRVLDTYPDGKPKLVAYKGPLDIRVTNTANGKSTDVDAAAAHFVDYRPDGSQMWYAYGPVMTSWRDNGGNMPRGLYRLDGTYTPTSPPTAPKPSPSSTAPPNPLPADRIEPVADNPSRRKPKCRVG
ncbi:hypothetical protein ACU686_44815 [Yinghuangia aomiensis]